MKILPILSLSAFLVAMACVPAEAAWSPSIGVNIGTGHLGTPNVSPYHGDAIDMNHSVGSFVHRFSWGTSVGLYHWSYYSNWHYGGELLYQNNGKDLSHGTLFSSYHVGLLGTTNYNFDSNWNLILKGGLAFVHQNVKSGHGIERTNNTVRPLVSAGIGYNIQTNMKVTLMYNRLIGSAGRFDWNENNLLSQDNVSLGLHYTF